MLRIHTPSVKMRGLGTTSLAALVGALCVLGAQWANVHAYLGPIIKPVSGFTPLLVEFDGAPTTPPLAPLFSNGTGSDSGSGSLVSAPRL